MGVDRKALKRAARANMRGKRPSPILVTLVYLLLTSGISQVVDFMASNPINALEQAARAAAGGAGYDQVIWAWMNAGGDGNVIVLFLTIFTTLYGMVLSFGYYAYTLRRTDGEHAGYGTLLSGFNYVGRIIVMQLVIAFFTFAWYLLTVLPAALIGSIIMAALLVLLDGSTLAMVLGVIFLYGAIIVGAILGSYLSMRYTLAPYFLADQPELGAMEAVRRSRTLLRSRLMEVFTLTLSFIGWTLLASLIPLAVGGIAVAVVLFLLPANAAPIYYAVGIYGGIVLAYLAALPFQMWLTPYYTGTFTQYYRMLVPGRSADLESGRPEPF